MTRVAAGFFLLLGGAVFSGSLVQWRQGGNEADWITVYATVEGARVRSAPVKGKAREYYVDVDYTYEGGGARRRGTGAFGVGRTDGPQDQSRRFERVYYKGQRIPVYYDPAHPEQSVVRRVNRSENMRAMAVGVFMLGAGVMLWRFAPRQIG